MEDGEHTADALSDQPLGLAEAVRFQRDLYLYWQVAHTTHGLALTPRGLAARPVLRRLRLVLSAAAPDTPRTTLRSDTTERDDPQLYFLRRTLARLGLLRVDAHRARLLAAPADEVARFITRPFAARVRTCTRLWLSGSWWPDDPASRAHPPRVQVPAPPRVLLARRHLIETLCGLAPGEAYAVPEDAALAPHAGRMPHPRPTARRVRLSAAGDEAPGDEATGDEATVRAALLGPLCWMGLVVPVRAAVRAPSEPAPRTVRAGEVLAALRHQASPPALREIGGRVVVETDFSIIAYPPLTAPILLTLDTCAVAVALDQVAHYRLTPASVAAAVRAGITAAAIATRLEDLAGAGVPANVRVTLADWERHGERLRLSPSVVVLEVRAPALLDTLLADRAAAPWIERRLSPSAALVREEHVARLRTWLLRQGELPAVTSYGSHRGGSDAAPS